MSLDQIARCVRSGGKTRCSRGNAGEIEKIEWHVVGQFFSAESGTFIEMCNTYFGNVDGNFAQT
jgi:hypothetical protein